MTPAIDPTSRFGQLVARVGSSAAIDILARLPLSDYVESPLPGPWAGASVADALAYRAPGGGDKPEHPWSWVARAKQLPPGGAWAVWVVQAGRGFGKTKAGAGFVLSAADRAGLLIAQGKLSREAANVLVIAPTARDLRVTAVEGDSGLLRATPPWMSVDYSPSTSTVTWSNGARAVLISADEPGRSRGIQGVAAWLDEIAIITNLDEVFSNVRLATRAGDRPAICCTTTPRNRRELRAILESPTTVITRGKTNENSANLAPGVVASFEAEFGGTHRGRQELDGELIGSSEFALWSADEIEAHRVKRAPENLKRVVVAVDPSGSGNAGSDECGIVVCAAAECTCQGAPALHGFVLQDCSLRAAPEGWARVAVDAYQRHRADLVAAETNFGADLVAATIRTIDANVPFKKLIASRGKERRAEPVSALSAQGKIHFVGTWPALEDQLTTWSPLYDKWSPDRLDAFVWCMTELVVDRRPQPNWTGGKAGGMRRTDIGMPRRAGRRW